MLCADFIVPRIMNNLKVTFWELRILKWRYFYNVIPRANKNTDCLLALTLWCHPRTEQPVNVSRKRKRDGNTNYTCWRSYKHFAGSAVLFRKGISSIETPALSSRPRDTNHGVLFWSESRGWMEPTWSKEQGDEAGHLTTWNIVKYLYVPTWICVLQTPVLLNLQLKVHIDVKNALKTSYHMGHRMILLQVAEVP